MCNNQYMQQIVAPHSAKMEPLLYTRYLLPYEFIFIHIKLVFVFYIHYIVYAFEIIYQKQY